MKYIADLHIHSHYSRATSKEMNIVSLTKYSQLKGTNVIGTGDFTHPKWFKELEETLIPADEPGLFKLRDDKEHEIQQEVPEKCQTTMRFMLTVEISTIYKKNDKVRKVHSVIHAPSFNAARKLNTSLSKIGNLTADGRPILGLDTKDLLKYALEADEKCLFVPAHIWTPHFSVFGSESGFDTLEEAFDELTPHIYAYETGLSSDPPMNWRIAELDSRAIVSNSDAHSPAKLGREATVYDTELSYDGWYEATAGNTDGLVGTIEFYPEEGKYHLDGHRACAVRLDPKETKRLDSLCSRCGKPVTVGVEHRVDDLAESDRKEGYKLPNAKPFQSIIPLPEIISEVVQVGVKSKRVQGLYMTMLSELGNEFSILLDLPIKDIKEKSGEMMAEAVKRVREGNVVIAGGYDGEYGTIKVFDNAEREAYEKEPPQAPLFQK